MLVLGGTAEARELAGELVARGVPVVSSLAGRVAAPRLPAGEVRIGGFGGPAGLAGWLRAHDVAAVVDATHPFAERISASAVAGAGMVGVPLLRLERPGWADGDEWPGVDWHPVSTMAEAAAALPALGRRVFLTTGRQGLAVFAGLADLEFLARCVDPPEPPLPPRITVLLGRGPYTVDGELALLRYHRIEVLVTKDSGGSMTSAKLVAARELGLPVVLVRRPSRPAPPPPTVRTVAAALDWLATIGRA
ncbi:precorrin-6A/cobalt-precorrin-6A reductase [Amycolatopsis arida]|uniref:Precorrin-6A/cobalt-precorrin-6A reductase n=1 Tax=Amycolatopsis arida TaxID=587909 RepID=A0A1I5LLW6_9PSEU|nr:cobalt-precorrin-6A reductase [Amycolatopsis arida]TDX93768.1 precorrin-6A/cobalt-precorrin-6A reductase [Amycolatopsis arida]SFO98308.1 precorrin-6A/cobalt-precorrin-6A reductase [Amycolatopsis arida]